MLLNNRRIILKGGIKVSVMLNSTQIKVKDQNGEYFPLDAFSIGAAENLENYKNASIEAIENKKDAVIRDIDSAALDKLEELCYVIKNITLSDTGGEIRDISLDDDQITSKINSKTYVIKAIFDNPSALRSDCIFYTDEGGILKYKCNLAATIHATLFLIQGTEKQEQEQEEEQE